jgi:mono/diheme cytochrome c family protein
MCLRPVAAARRAAVAWMLFPIGLCLVGGPAPARAENDSPPPPRRAAARSTDVGAAGKGLPSRCARCHDADGTGRTSGANFREIPDFSNHKWQSSRSDVELLVSILDGKGTHMPGFRGKLRESEARDLVASVRAFAPAPGAGSTATAKPDEFERRYRELQEELEDLKKQFREVSKPARKP